MRKIGLVASGIAFVGLVLLTILPVFSTYHLEDGSSTCTVVCLASDSILGRAGLLPEILTIGTAGALVAALYARSRRKEKGKKNEPIANVCQYCDKQISNQWLVCPFCGQSTVSGDQVDTTVTPST